ncbi:GH39 family glycosyl hydrolase [Flavicella sediminum]|uniref:GH39 family glycosyl hydrolase n=1 Tax=Flavicella sediminum TaxID=2585141 RepID=UPI0011236CB6|nr:hypothetical protein [Flavicella sediminum]
MKKALQIFILFAFLGLNAQVQDTVSVNFKKTIKKNINKGIASANLCWLTDSDLKQPNNTQSMVDAIKEMGSGSLRFPYGHLADNYLWHTPPFNDTAQGLRPKVATMLQAPGIWDWAVNKDGSFKAAMDFDEYMQLCKKLNIKPLVVVNVFSFKYKGGPTFKQLVESAVAWVKYAKKKNYHVEYWQIGNEVDHHPDVLTRDEYVACYQEIASAMKAVDASIKIGPGTLSSVGYFNQVVAKYPKLIDFASAHQYMWSYKDSLTSYTIWKEHADHYIPNILKMQKAVANSVKPNMEIVITETGVTPDKGMGSVNNMHKALWYFDVLMNQVSLPNVAYSYFWGTHSPWGGNKDNDKNDLGVLFRVDDNSRKPIAEVIKLVNEHVLDNMVATTQFSGYIRTFASSSNNGDKLAVFLMNKNDEAQKVVLKLSALPGDIKALNRLEYKGESAESKTIKIITSESVSINDNYIELTLAPLSITVLEN